VPVEAPRPGVKRKMTPVAGKRLEVVPSGPPRPTRPRCRGSGSRPARRRRCCGCASRLSHSAACGRTFRRDGGHSHRPP
jgi:hypothetical protein